jgi:transcriptional regulator with XRE-family HTH domain
MDPVPAGSVLRALRATRGRTIESLANASGIAGSRIAAIERWTLIEPMVDAPDEAEIGALARALESSLEEIVAYAHGEGYPAVLLGRRRAGKVELVFLHPKS